MSELEEYNNLFNPLKELFIEKCTELAKIELHLRTIEDEKQEIITNIRELQSRYSHIIENNFDNSKLEILTDTPSIKENIKTENLIDKYKLMKKPIRATDAETDDSESDFSDSDSDNSCINSDD